jgi:hypothetical protein
MAAVRHARSVPVPDIPLPARLDVHTQTADIAEVASWVKGVGIAYITRVAEGR